MAPEDLRAMAAADNAAWCDRVCRSHGLTPTSTRDGWCSPVRTPPFYPDAVTLRSGVDAAALLSRIDAGPGSSVKDCFADLDLAPTGFEVLFEAQWLHRAPGDATSTPTTWTVIDDPVALAAWQEAHGTAAALRPALLADPAVRVLARWEGDVLTGGAVASSSASAVGVSNVFARQELAQVWSEVPAVVAGQFPDLPLVGYEHDERLASAAAAGFSPIGPLRVWLREPEEPEAGSVCWLERVCDACGGLDDGPPAVTCPRCGAPLEPVER